MNPTLLRSAGLAAASLAVLGGLWWTYTTQYASPRSELEAQISRARERLSELDAALEDELLVRKKLRDAAKGTLGRKTDVVEHKFLAGLTALGERGGLSGVVASAGQPKGVLSPLTASNVRGVPTALKRALRARPDFEVVHGQLKGKGTLEQSLRTLASLQAQAWVHRVDGFSLRPIGKEDQFDLSVSVVTMLLPDLASDDENPAPIGEVSPAAEELWRAIASKNVFREPKPPAQPKSEVVVAKAGDPAPPLARPPSYDDWKLTGVVQGRGGVEAFLVNMKSGEKLTLQVGGRVLEAVLTGSGARGESAVFEIAGQRFEVSNGQLLSARRPVG